ncbi:ESPR-type extended signal peptide-containing protein [Stenotrophomonas lactitubi]|uniref:ESPR-type extended signal peptide-containing protein n=1 Tax=Stenotrophomonas lactitubi TaxID=2045214 RepID=UPI001DAF3E02|nr:ESPR-type extended signal peptide-containing protein [Stenotrophomonas lactitubi]CAH0277097.1 Autotransporter adhesin EhaG [Stenotrophomonas lactitubi]
MNKIYRRLWSTARQCWVVASELTFTRGKRAQTVRCGAALAAALAASPLTAGAVEGAVSEDELEWWERQTLSAFQPRTVAPASAGTNAVHRLDVYNNTSASGWSLVTAAETMAVGAEAQAGGVESIAVGIRSKAAGPNSVAVGNRAETYGSHAVAVGFGSRAHSVGSVSLGNASRAEGHNSMALGSGAYALGSGAIAVGGDTKARAEGAIVLGDFAEVANGNSLHSIAIGNRASAGGYADSIALGRSARAHGTGKAMALGAEANASHANSVALGANSATSAANQISVGNSTLQRKIVNLADGAVTTSSSEAVNGRQLNSVKDRADSAFTTADNARTTANTALTRANQAITNTRLVTQTSASSAIRVGIDNTGTVVDVSNRNGTARRIQNIANGVLSTGSTDAVTGQQLHATNQTVSTATTTANAAKASADAAVARISAAAVALGQAAVAEGSGSTASAALGSAAKAYNGSGVAMGADARAGVNDKGEKSTAATGAVAIGALSRSGNGAVATGLRASAIGDRAVALGSDANAAAIHSTAMGYKANASAESAVALGDRAVAAHTGSVALGNGSQTTAGNQISVGNGTLKRKIVNVADGALNTSSAEAVTGKQLNATNVEVASVRTTAASAQTTAGAAKTAADDALAKANALGGLVSQTSATGNVRLGGENTGTVLDVRNKSNASRKLTGVADATLSTSSTEAVSGKQLNATNVEVASVRTTATSAQTTANAARTAADNALGKVDVLGGLVSQVSATGNVRLGGANTGTVLDVRNKSNASRKLTGVADATLSTSSTEAVSGKQLNATNVEVASVRTTATSAQTTANAAKTTADNALGKADVLGGLVSQVSATGNVRLGGENTGTVLDVRNKSNANRKLTGVADATLSTSSTEVVTGRQLFGVDQKVAANQSLLASHATELARHETRIADNRRDLDDLRTEFDNFDPDLEGVVRYAADGSVDMDGGKVRGVAAGDISSAGSTDAVNGGQLFATNQRMEAIEHQRRFFKIGTDSLSENADAGWFGVAIGESAEASPAPGKEGGTAVGSFSKAMGTNSVALGRAAHVLVNATEGFALGPSSRVEIEGGVALGAHAQVKATATNGVALGYGSYVDQPNTVSVGSEWVKRRIVNVGRGLGSGDASTVEQLHEALGTLGGGAGMDASGNVVAPTYRMQGATQNNVADALAVLDGAVITNRAQVEGIENQLRSVFQDSPGTRSDGLGQLNLAGSNGMVLSNVANGLISPGSRDAVNGGQLFEVKQDIARNRRDLNELKVDRTSLEWVELRMPMATAADINFGGSRLTGISNGRISDASSDAITGSQLYQTNERVSDLQLRSKVISVSSTNESNSSARTGERSVAIGEYSFASVGDEGGTAVGHFAQARARNSVAIGQSSSVSSFNPGGLALGSGARADGPRSMAIGERAWVFGGAENSVAIGAGSEAMRSNEVSIGTYSNRRRLTSVANGIASYDAATAGQLRDSLSLLGGGATLDRQGNIVSPSYRIQGGQQNTVGDALDALDGAVINAGTRVDQVENQLRSVFQDSPGTRSDGLNQLTFAGANGMVLSNVANGAIAAGSRDAVNGGQLHSLQQQLNGRVDGLEQRIDGQPQSRALSVASVEAPSATPAHSPVADESVTPPVADTPVADTGAAPPVAPQANSPKAESPTPQVNTADLEKMLARANEYTDGAISNFERRLDKMDKRFNRMAAMSSAQTAMAMNTAGLATYNRLGAGVGYAEGESAMAVGYQRVLNEKGSATFSLNGAFTNSGERSMGVGVGIGW